MMSSECTHVSVKGGGGMLVFTPNIAGGRRLKCSLCVYKRRTILKKYCTDITNISQPLTFLCNH